jgi:hypothetical protein
MSVRCHRAFVLKKLVDDSRSFGGRTTTEPSEGGCQRQRVSRPWVKLGLALLDLAHEHIGGICRRPEGWIRLESHLGNGSSGRADSAPGRGEAERQDSRSTTHFSRRPAADCFPSAAFGI